MNRYFFCIAALAAGLSIASAGPIVHYDPIGAYCGTSPVAPAPGSPYSPSNLSEAGLPDYFCNIDVLPVGPVSTSPSIQLDQYLHFTVTGTITPTTLDYSFGYGFGSTDAAVRTSVDGFANNVALVSMAGLTPGLNTLMLDLSSLGTLSGTTEFRLYFYNAPSSDFVDLRSSADGFSNGLILNGPAAPEPSSSLLVLTGFGAALGLWKWRRRRMA